MYLLQHLPPEDIFNLLLLESAFNDQLITTCNNQKIKGHVILKIHIMTTRDVKDARLPNKMSNDGTFTLSMQK